MAVFSGPEIPNNGLVLHLDPSNSKSSRQRSNLLSWVDWVSGSNGSVTSTGTWPSYTQSGDGNSRTTDTNPFGNQDVVWDVSNQDATSDADGGFETGLFSIDTTKRYRFSVWMRRKTLGNGSSYLGPHSNWGAVAGQYILNRSNSAENQNPYFYAGAYWGNVNEWYLMVGHVWAAGSGSGSAHPDSGIYNTSGTKVTSMTDFMWAPTNTTSFLRSYLYYSTDITTNQQFYQPRVDVCDGNEPTIAELLADAGNKIKDISGRGNDFILKSGNAFIPGNRNTVRFTYGGTNWIERSTILDGFTAGNVTNYSFLSFVRVTNSSTSRFYTHDDLNSDTSNRLNYYLSNVNISGEINNNQGITNTLPNTDNVNKWKMYSGVIDGLNAYYYRGDETGFFSSGPNAITVAPQIGSYTLIARRGIDTNFGGDIGNFMIFNRSLSSNEVRQLFEALRGRYDL